MNMKIGLDKKLSFPAFSNVKFLYFSKVQRLHKDLDYEFN